MESDSESELLKARFEALKLPIQPSDAPKPQLSPTTSTIDRAALDADLRLRLRALGMSGSESGTEIDEEELERWLASEDEWFDEFNAGDTDARKELSTDIRNLVSKLNESGIQSSSLKPKPQRQDSTRTFTVRDNYKADSDADDEDEADEILASVNKEISIESRTANNLRTTRNRSDGSGYDEEDDDDGDDTDDEESLRGGHIGQRTPPSKPKQLTADTDLGRYEALFSSLETPRAVPTMTRTDPSARLPDLFARLQGINPHDGIIEEKRELEEDKSKPTLGPKTLGPAPKLDLEGWRAAKDDKPETWCCICNKDAELRCPGCDDDLYCHSCFKQGHDREDDNYSKHKPVNYPSPQD